MRVGRKRIVFLMITSLFCVSAIAQAAESQPQVLITNANIFDGGGRTLIPGLIDAHRHTSYAYAAQTRSPQVIFQKPLSAALWAPKPHCCAALQRSGASEEIRLR